jgi:hypothetical protein
VLLLFVVLSSISITPAQQSGPPLLTYDDLVTLYEDEVPTPEIAAAVNHTVCE